MPYEEINDANYTMSASAKGGRGGHVKSDDGVIDVELGKPGSEANPKANPETLFAAGYASCFSGALGKMAEDAGVDASDSTVTAKVTLGSTDTGVGLAVEILADLPGVDPAQAAELVEKAHDFCPYSKATRGNIQVTASAASS